MVTACRFVNSWAFLPSVEAFCLHIQQKIRLKFVFLHKDGGRKLVRTVDNYTDHTVSYVRRIEPSLLISPMPATCTVPCVIYIKVKQSRYRPGVAQRVPGS
jgi:hypothetical protein